MKRTITGSVIAAIIAASPLAAERILATNIEPAFLHSRYVPTTISPITETVLRRAISDAIERIKSKLDDYDLTSAHLARDVASDLIVRARPAALPIFSVSDEGAVFARWQDMNNAVLLIFSDDETFVSATKTSASENFSSVAIEHHVSAGLTPDLISAIRRF